ncbi:MAG: pro-sigmaK processing inhibitor BofA family protein [Ruthenibacterium sp.]
MNAVQIGALIFAAACTAMMCALLCKKRHPLRQTLKSAGCGIAALGAVNIFAGFTGVGIALNWGTAFVAVVLGAPGVICLLVLRLLL